MGKLTVTATYNGADGVKVPLKRSNVQAYDESSEVTTQLLADANAHLIVRTQNEMRRNYAVKMGYIKASAGKTSVVSADAVEA